MTTTSPFPGVNPFLESQKRWRDFHHEFIGAWRHQLLNQLPEAYDARLEVDVHLIFPEEDRVRAIIPDVEVDLPAFASADGATVFQECYDDVATATLPLPPPYEITQAYITIVSYPERDLVAVLECLSPTNKGSHSGQYDEKRNDILNSPAHLVELDLLVQGRKLPMGKPLIKGLYHSFVSRAEKRPKESTVAAWGLQQRLPKIPIPLTGPDEYVVSDLQEVFDTAWERGRFERTVNYTKPLDLPLSDDDRQWVAEQLKAAASQDNHE